MVSLIFCCGYKIWAASLGLRRGALQIVRLEVLLRRVVAVSSETGECGASARHNVSAS